MDVVVTGIGLLTCLGSLSSTWQNLKEGKSGIKLTQIFPDLPLYPLGMIGESPVKLKTLTELVVEAALKDAGLEPPLVDCGVVIGSSRGCQADWEELASNQNYENWLETLPHQGAVLTANLLNTTAPVLAPMAACATGITAIARGFELIQTGQCQRVIVGAVEAPITKLTLAGFERMGALATTGCYPFALKREGLVLGEGGAVLVLETAELATRRQAKIYGKILGFGLTCDAYHISAPASNIHSGIMAIKQCLLRSNLQSKEIDYIHAHGTSTKLNDAHEAQLIQALFPQSVAVSSTKGATGHTLGASGAIGTAICLMALQEQRLPPCVGLSESEFGLDLVTVERQGEIQKVLCFSFGFGGQNAVLALEK
ncbi:MAG: beta-ketoacyl-ACP synthase [Stanieria sp.]